MLDTHIVTLSRHVIEQERRHPEATGQFTNILFDLALAAKVIAREVNKAGIVDVIGRTDQVNVHGETVQKLDEYADLVILNAMDHTGNLCCMASEEHEEVIAIPERFPTGDYALMYDPLDGSSNIDVNVSIGTIFSIHRKVSEGPRGGLDDCLQVGRRQIAAGYVVYGSSTMLVYTSGAGVHGFTLDPSIGEFVLSHPKVTLPDPPNRIYSVNEAYAPQWSEGQRALVEHLKSEAYTGRYIGSLVSDFHRTLLRGGLFMYPADTRKPQGKLRLLYEAAPLAFVAEQAGGRASTGSMDIMDIEPTSLHQSTPLYMGSREMVDLAERFLAADGTPSGP
ncbi:MAG: class 1 fructose-bisphosphatase [Gemmatimonadetes bacterium]|nr:class 1 fructose-bisphosphatase [Gemmatimonadota bacterium]NNF37258.1 class 1 fructose-bisphosphatase [Gemmatimonadota bacterium]NNK63321.1 class 1 fructose-bisphosphatase [Gemmatimonadota bacterium]